MTAAACVTVKKQRDPKREYQAHLAPVHRTVAKRKSRAEREPCEAG